MRQVLGVLLIGGFVAAPAGALVGQRGSAPSAIKACSVLTRDLVEPFVENKRVLDLIPPDEETTPTYSACEYGSVRLQYFPAGARGARTAPTGFQPLGGVGETAFFRSNQDRYAELLVWSGAHNFTLQVSVPTGSTADAIKPKAAALANSIIQKLR